MPLFVSDPAEDMAIDSGGWNLEPVRPPPEYWEASPIYYPATTNLDSTNPFGTDATAGVEVSQAQNSANLNFAAELAMETLGIHQIPRQEWTQAQTVAYLSAVKNYILENPEQFTGDTYAIANNMNLNRPEYSDGLTGLDFGQVVSLAAEAAAPVLRLPQQVGETTLSMVDALNRTMKTLSGSTLLTLGLVATVVLFLGSRASGPVQDIKKIFR